MSSENYFGTKTDDQVFVYTYKVMKGTHTNIILYINSRRAPLNTMEHIQLLRPVQRAGGGAHQREARAHREEVARLREDMHVGQGSQLLEC